MSRLSSGNALRNIQYIPASKEKIDKIKVAAYARVSSKSDEQMNSLETQLSYYTHLIENQEEYEMVDVYTDEGISATTIEKRLEFRRMIDDARSGKIDRIITKSISRFARNTLDAINTVRELKTLGVSVMFEKENIDTEALSSENLFNLHSILAERESLSISQTCKKGIRMKMPLGEYVLTNIAYGYRRINGLLDIYEPEAEIVRTIYGMYLKGLGATYIANKLNEENIPTKNGKGKWRKQGVQIILRNEKYIGDTRLQKTFAEDIAPYKQRINRGELDEYYIEETHEPIISKVEYELVQMLIKQKESKHGYGVSEYMFAGKIECECCKTKLRVKNYRGKTYWLCRNISDAVGIKPCTAKSVEQKEIHLAFINMINKLKQNTKFILEPMLSDLQKVEEKKYKNSDELRKINKELAELSEQNLTMSGLLSEGVLDSALFMPKINEIKQRMKRLKDQKAILLREIK